MHDHDDDGKDRRFIIFDDDETMHQSVVKNVASFLFVQVNDAFLHVSEQIAVVSIVFAMFVLVNVGEGSSGGGFGVERFERDGWDGLHESR